MDGTICAHDNIPLMNLMMERSPLLMFGKVSMNMLMSWKGIVNMIYNAQLKNLNGSLFRIKGH